MTVDRTSPRDAPECPTNTHTKQSCGACREGGSGKHKKNCCGDVRKTSPERRSAAEAAFRDRKEGDSGVGEHLADMLGISLGEAADLLLEVGGDLEKAVDRRFGLRAGGLPRALATMPHER